MRSPVADMSSLKKTARTAGLLYLVTCIPAPFILLYVPNTLVVRGNAAATASRILASEWMMRLAIAGESVVREKLAEGMPVSEAFRTYGVI